MKIMTKGAFAATLVFGASTPAFAQSATGTGNATIVVPIAIAAGDTLEFGSVTRPSSGSGTIAIDATAGTQSLTGTGVISVTGGTTPRRGTFNVTGDSSRTFTTTVPGTLTLANGSNQLTVTLTSNAPAGLTAGAATIGIGGSLPLTATTVAGAYTGTYAVSVAYN